VVDWGYTLSSEEHGPRRLVELARQAEEAGLDFCSISDHFHPWVQAQGHSPFVWGVLGGVASVTERIDLAVGVTCPLVRIHPAVVAQASATASLMLRGRFALGVGTGEALNEHILGHRWPPPEVRFRMLEEAVEVIRALWTGETVDHHGEIYTVENTRLFDPPEHDVPIIVSGFGTTAAELAGRIGDGFWGHGTDPEPVDRFRAHGGTGPTYAQVNVCVGPDVDACRRTVVEQWPNAAVPGQLSQDLPTWTHFEQASSLASEDDVVKSVTVGPDADAVAAKAKEFVEAGFDHVYFHQIGPDQDAFFRMWRGGLADALRGL
jgi:G6PDH family F420-dependent oxidoreductase